MEHFRLSIFDFRLKALLLIVTAMLAIPLRGSAATNAAATQAVSETQKFLRFVDDGPKGARLEAAEVTYRNKAGVTLRLVSAVHIAEKSYYAALMRGFKNDDAVLYELVKSRGAAPPLKGQHGDSSVTQLQTFLHEKLNLEYQLDEIDYRRPNFVHADLDAETFQELQQQRGESMASLLMQSMTQAMSQPGAGGGDSTAQLLTLVAAPDPERQMKLMLAQEMGDIETTVAGLGGPNGSVILTERNKQAIRVLEQQLKAGRKHLSIFYGAAHMADLSQRVEQLGFAPVETKWQMAWDVTIRADKPSMLQKWFGGAATRPATGPSTDR